MGMARLILLLILFVSVIHLTEAKKSKKDLESITERIGTKFDGKHIHLMSRIINKETTKPFRYVEELSRRKRSDGMKLVLIFNNFFPMFVGY